MDWIVIYLKLLLCILNSYYFRWWVPAINDFLISSNEVKMNKFVSTYEIGEMKSTNALCELVNWNKRIVNYMGIRAEFSEL